VQKTYFKAPAISLRYVMMLLLISFQVGVYFSEWRHALIYSQL